MNEELIKYIESSFLKNLLLNEGITDISYNGEDLFYQTNLKGREKAESKISNKEAYDFIRQISNLSDSQFSFSSPILDISVGKYRINATHLSISRKNREKAINFSIRIGYDSLRIHDDEQFISSKCMELISKFIRNKESIIIGGITGSGKTEFQKYLLSKFDENTRLIVIDNVDELDTDYFLKNIDIQTWIINQNVENINFDLLIKNALRCNPDWLIVSEARGGEMLSLLNSSMSGHPTISTLHAKNIEYIYSRMTRMCMLKNENLKFDETMVDVCDHFRLLIYVKKIIEKDGKIKRFVSDIGTNIDTKFTPIFKYPDKYYDLPKKLIKEIIVDDYETRSFIKKWEGEKCLKEW